MEPPPGSKEHWTKRTVFLWAAGTQQTQEMVAEELSSEAKQLNTDPL